MTREHLQHSPPPAQEPEGPHPPRFHYLKRLSLLTVLLLLLLGALYAMWMRYAQSRLDAFVTDAHAHRRKVLLSDYVIDPVNPDDNIAVALRQAAASINLTNEQVNWEVAFTRELPLSDSDIYNITAIRRANQKALDLAHAARQRHVVDWGVVIRSPAINTLLPHLSVARHLAKFETAVALLDHTRGDDAEACQLMTDILFQARALDTPPRFLVTHLVSVGMYNLSTDMALKLAPDLKISPTAPASRPAGPATPQQVRALIDEFLDERDMVRGLAECWQSEQMMIIDTLPQLDLLYPQFPSPAAKLLRPMLILSSVRSVNRIEKLQVATSQPTYPAAMAITLPAEFPSLTSLLLATRTPYQMLMPRGSRSFVTHFRVVGDRRAAAISLALRLYAGDHHGRLPASLEELVPAYLNKLPSDPFSAEQKPFIYRPSGADPIIYSIGENGIDDGGTEATTRPAQLSPDYVYRLRPRTRPATAPR